MKRIETNKWCISSDGEHYHEDCESREEAIEIAKEDYKYDSFHIAKVARLEFTASDVSLSDEAYESLSEQLFEECGEISETWDNEVTKEQLEELDQIIGNAVIDWINKNNLQPKCFGITGDCGIESE